VDFSSKQIFFHYFSSFLVVAFLTVVFLVSPSFLGAAFEATFLVTVSFSEEVFLDNLAANFSSTAFSFLTCSSDFSVTFFLVSLASSG